MESLPTDVLRDILSRLETRDVARAACVSRTLLAASLGIPVSIDPRRRVDDVTAFSKRREADVRSFVARTAAATTLFPAFEHLAFLKMTRGTCWSFVAHLPPTLKHLECVANDSPSGVLHTRVLDRLPALRIAKIRVCKRGGVDLVVLDSRNELDTLHITRASTILFGIAPFSKNLRLEAQLLLPRDTRLNDCESLRLSSDLLSSTALDGMMPHRVADLSVASKAMMVIPAALPQTIRRFAFWAPSIIVDVAALRARTDTLEKVEVHARYTIGWTSSWRPAAHIQTEATVGGSLVEWF